MDSWLAAPSTKPSKTARVNGAPSEESPAERSLHNQSASTFAGAKPDCWLLGCIKGDPDTDDVHVLERLVNGRLKVTDKLSTEPFPRSPWLLQAPASSNAAEPTAAAACQPLAVNPKPSSPESCERHEASTTGDFAEISSTRPDSPLEAFAEKVRSGMAATLPPIKLIGDISFGSIVVDGASSTFEAAPTAQEDAEAFIQGGISALQDCNQRPSSRSSRPDVDLSNAQEPQRLTAADCDAAGTSAASLRGAVGVSITSAASSSEAAMPLESLSSTLGGLSTRADVLEETVYLPSEHNTTTQYVDGEACTDKQASVRCAESKDALRWKRVMLREAARYREDLDVGKEHLE